MGSGQSATRNVEEERRRKIEAERQEQQRRALEDERKRVLREQEEKQRKEQQQQKEELERKRRLEEEELAQKRRDEKDIENKKLEFKHEEEMQKIKDIEQDNQRKDNLTEKQSNLEHERLMQGQEQMFSILKDCFGKVKDVDINQAVYSAYIMQCIHSGKPIDKVVLEAVASKVPTPPLPNLEQIVENVIQKCEEGEYDNAMENRASGQIVSRQSFD